MKLPPPPLVSVEPIGRSNSPLNGTLVSPHLPIAASVVGGLGCAIASMMACVCLVEARRRHRDQIAALLLERDESKLPQLVHDGQRRV